VTKSRRIELLIFVVIFPLGVSAFTGGSRGGPRVAVVGSNKVFALSVSNVSTPPFQMRNYRTSGTYPQVFRTDMDLKAVNTAIRDGVLAAQRSYARLVRPMEAKMPQLFRPSYPYSGVYATSPRLRLISASTVVVSALIPLRRVLPGGNGGATWIAVTVQVPSGSAIGIRELFAQPSRGLAALADAVRTRVLSSNNCIRASVQNPVVGALNARGFNPTVSNYQYFALTTRGLAIGLPAGQVSSASCNRVETTVPYALLRPYLSKLARNLISGVRRPQ
jgi:hypothetical protein